MTDIKQLAFDLKKQLDPQLTHQQQQAFMQIIIALDKAQCILSELQITDQILHNCINAMTDNQRFKVAQQNCKQGLADGWAYRSDIRKQKIDLGHRVLGEEK